MKPFFDAPAVITAAVTLLLSACALAPRAERQARITPPTDCKAWVGVDRNAELPGYRITQANGRAACVPLLLTAHRPPPDYRGDYAVDEFTDEKLKARWLSCKVDAACRARIEKDMQRWLPPNKARATRVTGWVDPVGKIDPDGPVDLRDIRRPAFFARAPYLESIAQADARTSVVEFTVPHDPLEINRLGMTGDIKLRGWYIEGLGVPDANGVRKRALVIASAGGGDQITAIQDPSDVAVTVDPATGRARFQRFPNATTEGFGMRTWREHLDALNRAGFDVLAYDRRGEGLSGGFSDTNTLEQSEDIFRVLEQMENGAGMRLLTASGEELEGAAARGRLMAGMKAREIPLLLLGYSRGSMTTGWAMTKNYAGGCSYDMPTVVCSPARHFDNIKGALLYSPFTAGAAYLPDAPDLADRNLFLGGMAAENYVQFYPNSAVLAHMDRWPAAFFAKGLWDRAESLEGTVAAYDRIRGLKEIEVVRGPHQMSIWPKTESDRIRDRMVAFAVAAVNDQKTLPVPGASWSDLRGLVATTPDVWETSSQPR